MLLSCPDKYLLTKLRGVSATFFQVFGLHPVTDRRPTAWLSFSEVAYGLRAMASEVPTNASVAAEVAHLFRTKRVSEIRAIESQVRADAEEKSEALRELLGTRYKDLLSAADEVLTVRDASAVTVRDALRGLARSATELRGRFLDKSAPGVAAAVAGSEDLERRKNVHLVGSKLKHIVDSPEVLYACLESGSVYDAAVRYALAARNYHELCRTSGMEGVASRFAERRWNQVQVFRTQILAAAEAKLVVPGLGPKDYAHVFAALVILAGETRDINGILTGMLASRSVWVNDQLAGKDVAVPALASRIAKIVRETLTCISAMFNSRDSLLQSLLRPVNDAAANDVAALCSGSDLHTACLSWIEDLKRWLDEHGRNLLAAAETSRVLADTLRAIEDALSGDLWPEVCEVALEQPASFVFDVFKPFISERANVVASESVRRAADAVIDDIENAWASVGSGSHAGKAIWASVTTQAVRWGGAASAFQNSSSSDTSKPFPDNASQSVSREEEDVSKSLSRTGLSEDVIRSLEAALYAAVTDVTILTQRIPSVSESFHASVCTELPRVVDTLRSRLDKLTADASNDPDGLGIEQALFVARTSTALVVADNICSAYTFGDSSTSGDDDSNASSQSKQSAFSRFCASAENVASSAYVVWAQRLCLQLEGQLRADLTSGATLEVTTGWARVDTNVAGVDSGGGLSPKTSSSENGALRFPTAASVAAVRFAIGACRAANRAGGFALPPQAVRSLTDEMQGAVGRAYTDARAFYADRQLTPSAKDSSAVSHGQRNGGESEVAFTQMLFDVRFLCALLTGSLPSEAPASNCIHAIEQRLQSAIDPIDLAASRKLMQEAVSTYTARTTVLYGTLTRSTRGRSASLRKPHLSSGGSTSSNLVTLARTVPRFTYLPAPMPSTYSSAAGGAASLSAKAALDLLRNEAASAIATNRKQDSDISVAGYASKVSESVGRIGSSFFGAFTRG